MKKILLSTLAVVAISSAFTSAMEAKDDKMMMKDDKMMMSGAMATGSMMKDDKMMMSGAMATGAMMADDKKKMKENKMMEMSDDKKMMDHGIVVSYTAGSITKAIKEGKTVVLDSYRCNHHQSGFRYCNITQKNLQSEISKLTRCHQKSKKIYKNHQEIVWSSNNPRWITRFG
jgi:hypothetical protein